VPRKYTSVSPKASLARVPSRLPPREIARIISNTPRWVQETVQRYNQEGLDALNE